VRGPARVLRAVWVLRCWLVRYFCFWYFVSPRFNKMFITRFYLTL
jgi:hypothetical protein